MKKPKDSLQPIPLPKPSSGSQLLEKLMVLKQMLSEEQGLLNRSEIRSQTQALRRRLQQLKDNFESDIKKQKNKQSKMHKYSSERNRKEYIQLKNQENQLLQIIANRQQQLLTLKRVAPARQLREQLEFEVRQKSESLICIFRNFQNEKKKYDELQKQSRGRSSQKQNGVTTRSGKSQKQRFSDLYLQKSVSFKSSVEGRKSLIDFNRI